MIKEKKQIPGIGAGVLTSVCLQDSPCFNKLVNS